MMKEVALDYVQRFKYETKDFIESKQRCCECQLPRRVESMQCIPYVLPDA